VISVLIAWRISEHEPGHADKLFQYYSTNINALVQQQIRVWKSRSLFIAFSSPLIHFSLCSLTESMIFTLHRISAEQRYNCLWVDNMPDDDDSDTEESAKTHQCCSICAMIASKARVIPRAG
jgi:hypothetical protein